MHCVCRPLDSLPALSRLRTRFLLFLALFATILPAAHGQAPNVYITANGSPSGSCASNVQTPAFFNNSANWGTGPNQIGPGTTVHLCGTFSGTAGSSMLTVQGSGTNGAPVIIQFATGATLAAPYWSTNDGTSPTSGAISINGFNYIAVDGGAPCGYNPATGPEGPCNGTITSTADGTSLTYQQQNAGIYVHNATGIEIRNMGINSIYLRSGAGSGDSTPASGTADVYFAGNCTACSVHDSNLSDSRAGIWFEWDSSTVNGINVYNNVISHHAWGMNVGSGNASETGTNVNIYGNEITNWNDWADVNATYHTDGIILYAGTFGVGGSLPVSLWNNYIHGDLGGGTGGNAVTAFIYCTTNTLCTAFNNVLVDTGNDNYEGLLLIGSQAQNGHAFYNNTIVGLNQDMCIGSGGPTMTVENNIMAGCGEGIWMGPNSFSAVATSDRNVFYNDVHVACDNNNAGPPNCVDNLATWQAAPYNHDANSTTSNPNLSGSYQLQNPSSAIGLGANLTALNILALDSDKANAPRPGQGAWDAGAYQSSSGASRPATPQGLTVTVH